MTAGSTFSLKLLSQLILLGALFFSISVWSQENAEAQTPAATENVSPAQENLPTDTTEELATDPQTTEPTSRQVIAPPSLKEQQETDIKQNINQQLITPMLIEPNDFILLNEKDTNSTTKGVAILLPEWQQLPTNPKSMNFLRQALPKRGWTTLSIVPPLKPDNYPSHLPTEAERLEENQKLLQAYNEKLAIMLNSVMEKAQLSPGIILVIAEGNNAAALLDLYQQLNVPLPNALVMLSAHRLTEEGNKQLATNIANSNVAILDMFLTRDNAWVLANADYRKRIAKKELKTYYRQQQLTNIYASYYPEDKLLAAIKGWLASIGW